jgi:hypothetical protein
VPVASLRAAGSGRRDLARVVEVPVAGRRWRLEMQASGLRLPGGWTGLQTTLSALTYVEIFFISSFNLLAKEQITVLCATAVTKEFVSR